MVTILLKGKTIIVGVCGGIAAYKVVDAVSRLKKLNADVYVIMTENATKFVTPLTFQSISHNPVYVDMFTEPKMWNVEHIALAQRADLILIAPATANIIGKIANGIADCFLTTTVMASKAPVLFIPAMNYNMYGNPIVQSNIEKLTSFGYGFMEPDTGIMAEGTSGKGRLPEPCAIIEKVKEVLLPNRDLQGIKVLVTAGPTREALDPVRYITNHSSGKMGYAVAEAALKRGAEVLIVSGPVSIQKPTGAEVVNVTTAEEMYGKVLERYKDYKILIMVAAVADYKSGEISEVKIKKSGNHMTVELEKNPDIAKEMGQIKGDRILVGTCAETNDLIENAKLKIAAKNFDLIMANDVTLEGAGFGVDTNIVKLIKKDGSMIEIPKMEKIKVAHKLLDEVVKIYNLL